MRLAQFRQPLLRAAAAATPFRPPMWSRRPCPTAVVESVCRAAAVVEGRRHASVKSQGAYKLTSKKTLPKKLGAKKMGGQYVIPGNIIYKQRGTIWHPGENTILGRDHTIHAAVAGYVQYYRDPARHPDRQYIGVTFNRDDKLPYPAHAVRRRKLGLMAVPRADPPALPELAPSGIPTIVIRREGYMDPPGATSTVAAATSPAEEGIADGTDGSRKSDRVLHLGKNYSYHESNWSIGRLMHKHSFSKRYKYKKPWLSRQKPPPFYTSRSKFVAASASPGS